MPDCAIASSAARSASRSRQLRRATAARPARNRPCRRCGSCRPSVGKRVMRWMPDLPAVSLAQLSALPAPSEVTTPMPVTTTIGRPALSVMRRHAALLQPTASTSARPSPRQWPTPVTTTCFSGAVHRPLDARVVGRRKQTTTADARARPARIHRKLRLEPMTEIGAGGAHGKSRDARRGRRAPRRSPARRRSRPR